MRRLNIASIFLLAFISAFSVAAEINFPQLTSRVVDNANIIDAQTELSLTRSLEAHENASSNQVVVVTLDNLQGHVIEDFGYQLGRAWGIGQKGKNNGVILLVAQQERKVRIEVGYGLEGELTDAIAANIIHTIILPSFKQAKFNEGIKQGTYAIVQALGNQYEMRVTQTGPSGNISFWWVLLFIIVIFILSLIPGGGNHRGGRGGYVGGFGGSGGGFGGGGGGFSGGGGSFGGGGASGGW